MAETSSNPTYLERVFGFESEAVRSYMQSVRATYPELMTAAHNLDSQSYPAAVFACGSAWAELSGYRVLESQRRDPLRPFEIRNNFLRKGESRWQRALRQLGRSSAHSPYLTTMEGGVLVSDIRQAIAYKPLLEVFIAQRFGMPMTEEKRAHHKRQTIHDALKVGENVMHWAAHNETGEQVRDLLLGRIVGGILGQSSRYTVVPAPARRLYSELPGRRLAYYAIPVEPPYFRVPLQIVSKFAPADPHAEHTLVIDASQELVPGDQGTLAQTFDLLRQEALDNDANRALDDIRQSLTERFDHHRAMLSSMVDRGAAILDNTTGLDGSYQR